VIRLVYEDNPLQIIEESAVPPPIKESKYNYGNVIRNWIEIGGIKDGKEAFQA
jgi:hypothetical protein